MRLKMTDEDNPKNPPPRLSIFERLKFRRKMLGISNEEIAKDLDISLQKIKQYENQQPQDIQTYDKIESNEPKKYIVEIYEEGKDNLGSRELNLFHFEGINLLFEEIKNNCDYVIEFCARIKAGKELYDEFDKVFYEDINVLEIINIKKVKKDAK